MKPPVRINAWQEGYTAGNGIMTKAVETATLLEQKRIIELLIELNAIRRCAATNELCCFDTYGEKVIYLPGLENKSKEREQNGNQN